MKTLTRRSFLHAGAMAGASLTLWRKNAIAQSMPGFGAAKRVLILYAGGGLRSAPLFAAHASKQMNPFGRAEAPGAEWGVGRILGETPVPLNTFGGQLPPVSAIARDIAVLEGVDHDPASDVAVIDHDSGDRGVTTGRTDGLDAGLLTVIHKDHPGYRNGSLSLPPVDVGLSRFALGGGEFAGHRPVSIQSAESFTGQSSSSGRPDRAAWARALDGERVKRSIAERGPHVRPYLAALHDAKLNSRVYAATLHHPALDLYGAPTAELGGATNQQLLEALEGLRGSVNPWGLEVAFALRMLQFGSPAVSVMRYLYDTHSDEDETLPVDAGALGRQIAGLHFLLHRLRDTDGDLLWDRTVVVVVSEFGRDNTDAQTGFNSAGGSDHQGSPASRNQSWPVFGGPVAAAGKRIGRLDPDTLAGNAVSMRSVYSTLLHWLGISAAPYWNDAPVAALLG